MRIHCCTHEPDATVCTGSACALPSQHSSTKLAAKAAADEAIKPNTNLCCAQKSLSLEFVFGATNETKVPRAWLYVTLYVYTYYMYTSLYMAYPNENISNRARR